MGFNGCLRQTLRLLRQSQELARRHPSMDRAFHVTTSRLFQRQISNDHLFASPSIEINQLHDVSMVSELFGCHAFLGDMSMASVENFTRILKATSMKNERCVSHIQHLYNAFVRSRPCRSDKQESVSLSRPCISSTDRLCIKRQKDQTFHQPTPSLRSLKLHSIPTSATRSGLLSPRPLRSSPSSIRLKSTHICSSAHICACAGDVARTAHRTATRRTSCW